MKTELAIKREYERIRKHMETCPKGNAVGEKDAE